MYPRLVVGLLHSFKFALCILLINCESAQEWLECHELSKYPSLPLMRLARIKLFVPAVCFLVLMIRAAAGPSDSADDPSPSNSDSSVTTPTSGGSAVSPALSVDTL